VTQSMSNIEIDFWQSGAVHIDLGWWPVEHTISNIFEGDVAITKEGPAVMRDPICLHLD
jgi:hypothetical protein